MINDADTRLSESITKDDTQKVKVSLENFKKRGSIGKKQKTALPTLSNLTVV